MSIWSYLWPFGRKAKPVAPISHVPPSDLLPRREPLLGGMYLKGGHAEKPEAPPMQSVVRGGWDLRERRSVERVVPRRHGGVEVVDNSGEIADAAVNLITTIAETMPVSAPDPEPRYSPVETPHHSAPSHTPSHDSGQTYHHDSSPTHHHVDTSSYSSPSVDSSPSFSDSGSSASVSSGC